jgi:hypothetical protein
MTRLKRLMRGKWKLHTIKIDFQLLGFRTNSKSRHLISYEKSQKHFLKIIPPPLQVHGVVSI